jgi:FkbM family methyltransferase
MKNAIKFVLQKLMGYEFYLYIFSIFKIKTLAKDSNEKDFFYFLSLLKNEGKTIIDIGANIGIMTYHLAKKFPNCTVIAIEPIPSNFSILSRIKVNFRLQNVELLSLALSNKKETVKMVLPTNAGTKMQGLSHIKHPSIVDWNVGDEFEVMADTIDNLFSSERIQGIKLDVENFEYFVLQGGIKVIEANRPIIYVELWDNENRTNCFNLLKSLNYNCFVVENNHHTPFDSAIHKHQNFLFLPTH